MLVSVVFARVLGLLSWILMSFRSCADFSSLVWFWVVVFRLFEVRGYDG